MKSRRWNEDKKTLTKQAYEVAHFQTISLAEHLRFIYLGIKHKPMLPEEWVIVRH